MTEHRQTRRVAGISDAVDTLRPNAARMYDYFLDGSTNFEPDRAAAEQCAAAFPGIRKCVRVNRAFLGRVVRYLCLRGIDQFLDLGSGVPTVGNVHEIAHGLNPAARIAYVDHEPVAVAHARRQLAGDPRVSVAHADIRRPGEVLTAPEVAGLLDFGRPVGVLAVAILPFVPDAEDPTGLLATYRDACVPGSYLALSHVTQTTLSDAQVESFLSAYRRTRTPVEFRSRERISEFLQGYELIDPGLVLLPHWRPEQAPDEAEAAETNVVGALGFLSPRDALPGVSASE